ncbi:hypothetical protein V8E53_011240 [Lactarius tabidus]
MRRTCAGSQSHWVTVIDVCVAVNTNAFKIQRPVGASYGYFLMCCGIVASRLKNNASFRKRPHFLFTTDEYLRWHPDHRRPLSPSRVALALREIVVPKPGLDDIVVAVAQNPFDCMGSVPERSPGPSVRGRACRRHDRRLVTLPQRRTSPASGSPRSIRRHLVLQTRRVIGHCTTYGLPRALRCARTPRAPRNLRVLRPTSRSYLRRRDLSRLYAIQFAKL